MRTGIQTESELEVTREKLRLLEERYEAAQRTQHNNVHVREDVLWSLKRLGGTP